MQPLSDVVFALVAISFGITFVTLVILLVRWHYLRCGRIVNQWAESNGYELLSVERRLLCPASFFWTLNRWKQVYFVKVRKPDGEIQCGWVRCGDFILPTFADSIEVCWDDSPPSAASRRY
jgi:hypothetical protein